MTEAKIPIHTEEGYATMTIAVDGALGKIIEPCDLKVIGETVIDDVDQLLRHTVDVTSD